MRELRSDNVVFRNRNDTHFVENEEIATDSTGGIAERGYILAGMSVPLGKTQEIEMRDVRSGNALFRNRNEILFAGNEEMTSHFIGKRNVF